MFGGISKYVSLFTAGVFASLLLFGAQPAIGKSKKAKWVEYHTELLEVLKRKGIISQGEYDDLKAADKKREAKIKKELAKRAEGNFKVVYKPGGGFRLNSKDKKHQLRIGVQTWAQAQVLPKDSDNVTDFRASRARLTFRGKVHRHWTYRLELDAAASNVFDQDGYIGWEKHKEFKLRIGQHKTPFGGEQTYSRGSLFFLERSMIGDNIKEGKSRGIYAFGRINPMFAYKASISNGTGGSNDNNIDKDYALRLIMNPFKGHYLGNMLPLEVNLNVAIGQQAHSSNGARTRLFLRNNRLTVFNQATEGMRRRFGGDIWYNKDYKAGFPVSATFEFIYEDQEMRGPVLGRATDKVERYGWHLQGGWMLTGSRKKDGLEFVAKYEQIDMDDQDTGPGDLDIAGQTVKTVGLGMNYWPVKEIRFSFNGFVFDFDQPLTTAADTDPFNNGGSAWAVLAGAHFKF